MPGNRKGDPFKRWGLLCLFMLLSSLFIPGRPLHAHSVYIYAWVEGDTVYTESYFGSNKRVMGGLVKVFDPSGKKLLEGKTNEQGEFSFKIPEKTDLRIVLDATMGHGAEFILRAGELPGVAGTRKQEVEKEIEKRDSQEIAPTPVQADVEQIRTVMEKVLDSRLNPIIRSLAKIQEEKGPGMTEIVGGIGYIVGIMGLVLFFRGRKRN